MKWLLDLIGLPSPYALLTYIVVAVGLFGMGTYTGWHEKSLRVDAANLKTETVAFEKFQAQEIVFNNLSQTLELKLQEARLVTLTITKQVDQVVRDPLYDRACLDDAGLQLANQAIVGTTADPSKPDGRLRVLITPAGRNGGVDSTKAGGD